MQTDYNRDHARTVRLRRLTRVIDRAWFLAVVSIGVATVSRIVLNVQNLLAGGMWVITAIDTAAALIVASAMIHTLAVRGTRRSTKAVNAAYGLLALSMVGSSTIMLIEPGASLFSPAQALGVAGAVTFAEVTRVARKRYRVVAIPVTATSCADGTPL